VADAIVGASGVVNAVSLYTERGGYRILSGMPHKEPKRLRATQQEMQDRRLAVLKILQKIKPASVRQTFYQASVQGLTDKTEDWTWTANALEQFCYCAKDALVLIDEYLPTIAGVQNKADRIFRGKPTMPAAAG
jgi:hypothetical protein